MSSDPIVILAARRTPVGAFQGVFAGVTAPATRCGGHQGRARGFRGGRLRRSMKSIMGCVLSAGLGQAPARQAALGAGIPTSTPATTVNKMCGSAMRAVMLAADQILAGSARSHRGRRPRVDDQRALSAAQGPGRAIAWATRKCSITCSSTACRAPGTGSSWAASPRRPSGKVRVHAPGAGRLRDGIGAARAGRRRQRRVRERGGAR